MAQINVGRTPLPRYELPRDDVEFNEQLRAMWTARQAAGTAPPTVYGTNELPADFLNNPRVRAAYLTGLLYWGLDVYEENDVREDDYRVLRAEFWGRPTRMPYAELTGLMNRATADRAQVRIDRWLAPPLIGTAVSSVLNDVPQFGVFGAVDAAGRQATITFSKLDVIHAAVLITPASTAAPAAASTINAALASAASASKQVVVTLLSTGATLTGLARMKRKNYDGDFLVLEVDVTGGSVLVPSWDVATIAVKP